MSTNAQRADTRQGTPLAGLSVLLTRAAGRSDSMAARLRALGAEPVVCPTIAYAPPADPAVFDAALARLASGGYGWLVLTSRTAVEAVAAGLMGGAPSDVRIAAVGPATAAACVALLGIAPSTVPDQFVADQLAAALGDLSGQRVLLPNADIAPPTLEACLRAAGAIVDRVIAYDTLPAPANGVDIAALLDAGTIDIVTFTSGSTVRAFVDRIGQHTLARARQTIVACIGPSTAAACRAATLEPTVVASESTEAGLIAAIVDHVVAAPNRMLG